MQDFLTTAATLTEAAIALFIILGAATMPRRRPSPGQLEIEFAAPEPLFPVVPYLLLLPAAPMETKPNWAGMNPQQLRQQCQQQGIKWRNAHGRNKHLSKREMVQALSQPAIAA